MIPKLKPITRQVGTPGDNPEGDAWVAREEALDHLGELLPPNEVMLSDPKTACGRCNDWGRERRKNKATGKIIEVECNICHGR